MKTILLFMMAMLFYAAAPVHADEKSDIKSNREELKQIKQQLEHTQNKVDSLKNLEKNLQKAISGYDERVSRNRKLVGKLNSDLKSVRQEIDATAGLLDSAETKLKGLRVEYAAMVVGIYRSLRTDNDDWFVGFDAFMEQKRRNHYDRYMSRPSAQKIAATADTRKNLAQQADSLSRAGSDLSKLQKEKKSKINLDLALKEKEEASLGNVRSQKTIMQDRLISLSEVAQQMEEIIERLEQEQKRRRDQQVTPQSRFRSGSFAAYKGQLFPPIKGKIVSSFGWKVDNITKLKSFSPGIDIKPSPGISTVTASAPGRVAYVGTLRGYDKFVIIEHDDGFYTTYAGLAEVMVELDDLIDAGEKLGVLGAGVMHYEIRQGREHLDPVIWLKLDEF